MLLLERQSETAPPRAGTISAIRLRVRGDGPSDQLVDLAWGRTTVGSSPRCTVYIRQPGVHPLHCLIVYGAEGLSVRRWAADTLLNGRPFDDAPLAPGDWLTVGPVDVEVVAASTELVGERLKNVPKTDNATPRDESADLAWIAGQEEYDDGCAAPGHELIRADPHAGEGGAQETAHHTTVGSENRDPAQTTEQEKRKQSSQARLTSAGCDDQDVARLRAGCALVRRRSRKLLATLRRDRDAHRQLQERLAALEEQLKTVAAARESTSAELHRAKLKLADRQLRACEFDSLVSAHQELANIHALVTEENARLKDQINQHAHEQASAADAQKAMASEHAALTEKCRHLAEQNARLCDDATQLTSDKKTLTNECERLRQLTDQAQADITRLTEQNSQVASQNTLLQDEHQELSDERERLRKENTQVWDKVAHLSEENAALLEATSVTTEERDRLSQDCDRLRNEVAHLTSAEAALSDKNLALAEQRDRLRHENDRLGNEIARTAIEKTAVVDENIALANEKAELITELADVRRQLAESDSQIADHWRRIEKLEQELSTVRSVTAVSSRPVEERAVSANWEGETPGWEAVAPAKPFAKDANPAVGPKPTVPPPPATGASLVPKPRSTGYALSAEGGPSVASNDEEESIDEYMAKLLQRVRGDTPRSPAPQAPPTAPSPPVAPRQLPADDLRTAALSRLAISRCTASEPLASKPPVCPPVANLESTLRKATVAEETANLEAFRTLANETARHAIGVHATRSHRRIAVTGVIVSMLAGMTSLWLMLEAPDWRDLQFITACVSLLAAAYWAGQTVRAVLESRRASAYDGPDDELDDWDDPFHSSLPIEMEESVR